MSQVNPMVDPTKPSGLSHINHNQLSGLAGTHSGLPIPGALNHLSNNPINHLTQAALHQQVRKIHLKSIFWYFFLFLQCYDFSVKSNYVYEWS